MEKAASTFSKKSFWIKQIHRWHWMSSALCLIGMILFVVTGITLNHASEINSRTHIEIKQAKLPEALLSMVVEGNGGALPQNVSDWLERTLSVSLSKQVAEWSEDEIYFSMPRPGGDAWLSIQRSDGAVQYETTDRGLIAWMNDLHKGRHTGLVWRVFLDVFSLACLVFCMTGLFLLKVHADKRRLTWKVVGVGLAVPMMLSVFAHL
ncbi:MAG: PepSY-associated TM helix domain-containing protein [Burkholderiales bacterium]|jgi:hypothetical protein|nr:PepSY-associated TM helix domain-containing protein [Burkholderiales bacterium]